MIHSVKTRALITFATLKRKKKEKVKLLPIQALNYAS